MNKINKRFVEELIDYRFKNSSLLYQAYVDESLDLEDDNLGLALVGESCLDMLVTSILVHTYSDEENIFSLSKDYEAINDLRQGILSKKYLMTRTAALNLKEIFDDGNKLYSDRKLKDMGVTIIKALVGAVAYDSGYNHKALIRVCGRLIDPINYILSNSGIDYPKRIDKFTSSNNLGDVSYEIDLNSDNRYVSSLYMQNPGIPYVETNEIVFTGYGFTKEEAKGDSARIAYDYLTTEGYFIPSIFYSDTDRIYSLSRNVSTSKSFEIVSRLVSEKLLSKPCISIKVINKRYYAEAKVDEYDEPFKGDSSKIDTARRRALANMLRKINDDIEGANK